jgi:hypothetical protein
MSDPVYPPEFDFSSLSTYPLADRPSKVDVSCSGRPFPRGGTFAAFLDTLPDQLGAADLKALAAAIAAAAKGGRPILWGLGGHVVKVGLGPVLAGLMERGAVTGLVLNGAAAIHDLELAIAGKTSEVVDDTLLDGKFGLAAETGALFSRALTVGVARGMGLGEALSATVMAESPRFADTSLLCAAHRLGIPVTVHVAVGTDIVHIHPGIDPRLLGEGTFRDFARFTSLVADLSGGVFLNVGSAVLLPEVFLKAVSAVSGKGISLAGLTTANLDFIQHYRPRVNVLARPTSRGGKGFALTGHHEIMVPLLAAAVGELLEP